MIYQQFSVTWTADTAKYHVNVHTHVHIHQTPWCMLAETSADYLLQAHLPSIHADSALHV